MEESKLKIKVQRNILIGSILIMVGKFTAYLMTSSVGILTDALESIVNVAAGSISLYSLHWAGKPKDKEHPFGHGKMELLSASAEGAMISIAGLIIIYNGIERLIFPVELRKLDIGIIIVAISGLLNYLMGLYSIRIGKKYSSIALIAGGKHLQSDTYSTIGLVIGLLLLYFTGINWIDSAVSLIFGTLIIVTGISILRKTIANLLDTADKDLIDHLVEVLNKQRKDEWIGFHNIKITKYGNMLHLDCDLVLPWFYTVAEAHETGNEFKQMLNDEFKGQIEMTLHFDPCNIFPEPICHNCKIDCKHRKAPFTIQDMLDSKNITDEGDEQSRKNI